MEQKTTPGASSGGDAVGLDDRVEEYAYIEIKGGLMRGRNSGIL